MPSHFHWIVKINTTYGSVTDIMRDLKKYSAWDIMQYLTCKSEIYKGIFNPRTFNSIPENNFLSTLIKREFQNRIDSK